MDIKNTLAKWYKGRSGTDSVFRSTSLEFPEILIDQCISDLKVKEEAKSDGESNVPNSGASSFSGTEQRLQVRFDGDKAYHTNMAQEVINSFEKQCFNHDLEKKGAAFTGFELLVDNEHDQLKAIIRDVKIQVQEKLKSSQKEHDEFKTNNKIERSCRTPRSDVRVFSIISVMMLIETILNAGFIVSGIGSYIQAALYALTLSGINILFGFFIGRKVITYKNHINKFYNLLSYLFFLFYVAFIFLLNFVIAHWRDLSAPAKQSATFKKLNPEFLDAVTKLTSDPFGFSGNETLIFLLVGIGFSFYALYEGYNSEDPYPGYGLMHRRLEDARDDYLGQKELSLKEIDSLREGFLADIISKSDAIKHSYTATKQCTTELENYLSRFNTYMEQLDRYCYAVLSTYRNENEKSRNTKTPKYFDEQLIIKDPPILKNRLEELGQILTKSKPIVDNLQVMLESINKYIWKVNNSTRKEYEELENF